MEPEMVLISKKERSSPLSTRLVIWDSLGNTALIIFLLVFACTLKMMSQYVSYDYHKSFPATDHNINMFSKIALFLQKKFTKKLICDLISQLNFKLYSTN